jgi:hypothetical protein
MRGDDQEWTSEEKYAQFIAEIRDSFATSNASHRAQEAADLAAILARGPELQGVPGFEVRDSFEFDIWSGITSRLVRGCVIVMFPPGFAIYAEFIERFANTSVAWSFPNIIARVVEGRPRVGIEVMLIDDWDDDRARRWIAEHSTFMTESG